MAFTETERSKIRIYTGRPLSPRRDIYGSSELGDVETAMDEVQANPDREAIVRAQLAVIAAIETEIAGVQGFLVMKKAEELTINENASNELRTNLTRECQFLAQMLGVKVHKSPTSTGWTGGSLPMG